MRSTTTHTKPMTHCDACECEMPDRELVVTTCPLDANLSVTVCLCCELGLAAAADEIAREHEAAV